MALPRIYADFQNLDGQNRVRLTCAGTLDDLKRQEIVLREGLVLTLTMDDADDEGNADDLLADGVVTYNADEHYWVAAVDWAALRHASEESMTPTEGRIRDAVAPVPHKSAIETV